MYAFDEEEEKREDEEVVLVIIELGGITPGTAVRLGGGHEL